ncbi:MAG TPA: type II restriction endonuclease [Candidatus Cloacimonetes bacterium]|nr:type II restriction endonuclease [Candidatus Cloacimonadota bacterium]
MNKTELGSKTAKGGFANEKDICIKFNDWKKDGEAKEWLEIMGYDISKLNSVKAIQIPTRIKKIDFNKFGVNEEEYEQFIRFKKADAQISIIIKIGNILKIENLSLKKANKNADYNQIDKRSISNYQEMWNFDDDIAFWLKLFTGESNPQKYSKKTGIEIFRDNRRLFLNEMPETVQNKIINFFEKNKIVILNDIIRGRGGLSADWMLVTRLDKVNETTTWILNDINTVMNFFGKGEVCISPRGSLRIGKITMQRKGGTPDPTKLQFKIKPCQLFNPEK